MLKKLLYGETLSQQSMDKWIPDYADVGYEPRIPSCLPTHKPLGNATGNK